ncbi:MAG: hypothetical protein KAJ19_21300, partial [Gammaproteobacteria bacterium]|nr:hypothetical protein [Gammaproteobacteria bacterium]
AAVGASPATVNNLDLQLIAPNGTAQGTFWGNRFASEPFGPNMWLKRGYSIPLGVPDSLNTNEGINITTGNSVVDNWLSGATAASGDGIWKVRVIATNVPVGPQPFGLVVTGDLNTAYGILTIDKKVYSESDTINIMVIDTNLAAPANIANVTSTSEPGGELVVLTETAFGSGIWKGSIDTEFNITSIDGKLQVHEGDLITVSYSDISPTHVSVATAIVDSSGPVITNVWVKDITNAVATVTWDTDEPSTSKVYYGKTLSLGNIRENPALMVNHEIQLTGLSTDTIYYFDVESADWFGHTTRDTFGGEHYSFRTIMKAEILVVFGDETFDAEDRYRSALDAYGWSYNEWYAENQGDPPLTVLKEYKVVMWQPGYEQYPPISDTQRPIITNYLDGGGRLFISSHDIAWSSCADTSQFMTPERCMWFNSTLKVKWMEDPYNWPTIDGILGNAISNAYPAGSGVPYSPTRDGAAGDEIECTATDGLCEYTWWNSVSGFNPIPGYIANQWTSAANNGTMGDGVWGGFPSKMVTFFLEFTRMNAAIDKDPTRDDILNKVIRWLLGGRDHPRVWVSSPNGGETFTTSPITISWSASTFGTLIDKQSIYYSPNAGQSWFWLEDVGPTNTTYNWDITAIPNGNQYMVRVVVQDDGLPALIGSD